MSPGGDFPFEVHDYDFTLPLFSAEQSEFLGVAILRPVDGFKASTELDNVLHRVAQPIGIAIERELVNRALERERRIMYERSIRDPLTNLFTRRYLNEAAGFGHLAERIRSAVESLHPDTGIEPVDVTISLGVASHSRSETLAETVKKADVALYRAKESGRNKVCLDI